MHTCAGRPGEMVLVRYKQSGNTPFCYLRRLVGYPWRLAGTSGRLSMRIRAVTGECPRGGGGTEGTRKTRGGRQVNNEARVKMWRDEGNGAGGQGVRKHNGSKSGA